MVSGGNDIAPEHYGGDIEAPVEADPARDALEIEWIRGALDDGLPLLGICRGAQLINVVLGGNLRQDIRSVRKLIYKRPGLLATKQVWLEPGSVIAGVCGKTHIRVNGLHHQASDMPGSNLEVVGRDLDEFVQAVECSAGRDIVGVQGHPEYLFYLPAHFALFRWLVSRLASRTPESYAPEIIARMSARRVSDDSEFYSRRGIVRRRLPCGQVSRGQLFFYLL